MKNIIYACFGLCLSFLIISCSEESIDVTIVNGTKTDFNSYVIFTEESRTLDKVTYKKGEQFTLEIPKGEEKLIALEANKTCDILFFDVNGYQYVKRSVKTSDNLSISFSNTDFVPRDAMELITKKAGLPSKSKEVKYVKD